jgi:penicillin amidase
MKVIIKFFISAGATVLIIILLNIKLGQLPPLGKFLDPIKGIWQNGLIADIPSDNTIQLKELSDEVKIVFNNRAVPHIFAKNQYDLYFAAGYVTAMHRLWQMEFSTHASMGRLSEIVGERALEYDKYIRKLGMVYGAEKMLEETSKNQPVWDALQAYSDGVNAWIKQLDPKHYPFEYKMLDYAPEPWKPLKTLALGMGINRTLSSSNQELKMSYLEAAWGRESIIGLFAARPQFDNPIIQNKTWAFKDPSPATPAVNFIPQFIFDNLLQERNPNVGSNNWAVSGRKTASGEALLATDPHLELTLPSIWYEMQLNAPGINAYGVTFPGVPAIIMGFNENIAWGNTNTGNDVFDIFEIETDSLFQNYYYNGKWIPLQFRKEVYSVKGSQPVIDSIAFTHHGPVLYRSSESSFASNIPVSHAISWTGHDAGDVIGPLQKINTSKNFIQFREALSGLNAPPQNYVFACIEGDIGMQLNGLWPNKWLYQGMFIGDGRNPEHDWKGYLPFDNLPFEHKPARGYVSSANQEPTDSLYPFYHGWHFASPARSNIINNTLENNKNIGVDDMKALQHNSLNFWAEQYLGQMTDSIFSFINSSDTLKNTARAEDIARLLVKWDKINEAHSIEATVFETWREETFTKLWAPVMEPVKDFGIIYPSIDVSFSVLFQKYPVQIYHDIAQQNPSTSLLLYEGLQTAINKLEKEYGPMGESWQWWKHNGSTINHLLNIEALNEPRLKNKGSSQSPNAVSGTHGPSWRMVTQMSNPVKAWGVYPGGQTGNPASKGYNAFIKDWAEGSYYELILFDNAEQAAEQSTGILTIQPTKTIEY